MGRKKFNEYLHDTFDITNDVILDRIFKYFNKVSSDDLDVEEWVIGFSVVLKGKITQRADILRIFLFISGSDEEQLSYCFEIYDLNEDGYITKEEMITMMTNCLFKIEANSEYEGDEGVKVLRLKLIEESEK